MSKKTLIHNLQKLDLTKNDSLVFTELIQNGASRASDISKKTGLHRQLVYNALEHLQRKQLIRSYKKQKVSYFQSRDSKTLEKLFEEKLSLAQDVCKELEHLQQRSVQDVIVHEGLDELKRIHLSLYQKYPYTEPMYIIGSSSEWKKTLGNEIIQRLISLQKKKKIITYIISPEINNTEKHFFDLLQHLVQYKTIPFISNKKTETAILKDRVFIKIFSPPYTVIELINPEIVSGYKEYFLSLWKQEEQISIKNNL